MRLQRRGEDSGIALREGTVLTNDEIEVTRFRPVHERLKSCLDEGLRGVSGGDEGDDPGRGLGRAEAVIGIDGASREAFVLAVFPEPVGEVFEGAGDHPVIMDGAGDIGGEDGIGVVEKGGDRGIAAAAERKRGAGADEERFVFRERREFLRRRGPGEGGVDGWFFRRGVVPATSIDGIGYPTSCDTPCP